MQVLDSIVRAGDAGMSRLDFEVMDRNTDPALDELTEFTAVLSGADYCYIGWLDFSRLWFKSRFGFMAADQPRSSSACQYVVEDGKPLIVNDAGGDSRFPPGGIQAPGCKPCRSYVGLPLRTANQQVIGTLAILGRKPNLFSPEHVTLLEVVSRQIITRLELYNRIRAQEQAQRSRQRTERALAMERCFVAATLDSIPALVVVLDTAGRVVRFNQPCAHLTGLNPSDAAGRPFADALLEADDRSAAAARVREAASGQSSAPQETWWRVHPRNAKSLPGDPSADSPNQNILPGETAPRAESRRRVSWTLRPLKGPNGDIQYLIVSGQDVTDQREAEEALLSSEHRYREVVESSLGFVFTCTMEGRLTSLNAFTAETLGYRMEDLSGRQVTELLDSSGAVRFKECLGALKTQEEWQGSIPIRRSDGLYRRIAFRSRRMELHGERPFILIHGMDVTEQHEAEEALHIAMRQRELILESVGDGIYGIDLEGRLTFINEAGSRLLGYEPEELTGREIHEIIHHSHADGTPYSRVTSPILQGMRRREAVRMRDEVFWRHDGTKIPVEYIANPLIEEGQLAGMVVAFQDVSEQRRLDRMKDEFISTVSHELRTPLTSLRASLGLISSGALDKRPEKQRQMIEMAIGNCDRLVRLVNDILDFEKMESGRHPLNRTAMEPIDLLRRASDVAHSMAAAVHISVQVKAGRALVYADADRIMQVLNELVSNAIKFSAPETVIRLGTQPAAEGEVCFVVEDQGRGIAPEKLDHIFDRFQQGDASDSRALGGTGLGLALCRSIVEQHGGRIWAESTPGKGSRFLFTLPAAERVPE
jgi:two-component system, OmpR family, sensor histidine kinase VicK